MNLPICVTSKETSEKLKLLGAAWAADPARPRIEPSVRARWHDLISAWADSTLPLAIRKSESSRGAVVLHQSGRELICADNSPAQWAFAQAFAGKSYTLSDVERILGRDELPFAFAIKGKEKSELTYRRSLGSGGVNRRGWKLCHIDGVGLRSRIPLAEMAIESLKAHFVRLMSPGNHFLVPKIWGGLGEVPEFIAAIREYERHNEI